MREVLGPASREKASLIRKSDDQILLIFSCSIYFHNENVILALKITKLIWYIFDLWFRSYSWQIPSGELCCETIYAHYVVYGTQGHLRKKYDVKLHVNFRNRNNKTLISCIPYSHELFHGLQNTLEYLQII